MDKSHDSLWHRIKRRVTGIGSGHLYNPWWCSSMSRGNGGFSVWWRVCDYFGVNLSHRVKPSKWLPSHPKEVYVLLSVEAWDWRFEILRPHRYTRFPWERYNG